MWALIGIYVEKEKKIKQFLIMEIRLGVYLFNADICILNTDISFNKYICQYFSISLK